VPEPTDQDLRALPEVTNLTAHPWGEAPLEKIIKTICYPKKTAGRALRGISFGTMGGGRQIQGKKEYSLKDLSYRNKISLGAKKKTGVLFWAPGKIKKTA